MIEIYSGPHLWTELESMLRTKGHREAAIAYIGIDAKKYLKLKRGDVLVFDGDDRSIKQNHIHLPTIKALMKAGVVLYSCPGLHSKMLVVEAKTPFAIVGSANASRTSVEEKIETVVRFDEPDAVMKVRVAIGQWSAGETPLTPQWLDRVSKLPRDKRSSGSRWKAPRSSKILADSAKPLWVSNRVPDTVRLTRAEQAALDQARAVPGVEVETFRLTGAANAPTYNSMKRHDSILLINWDSDASEKPRANARVFESAKIINKVASTRGAGGLLLVAWRQGSATRQWRDVLAAIEPDGVDHASPKLSAKPRKAVFDLFAGQ